MSAAAGHRPPADGLDRRMAFAAAAIVEAGALARSHFARRDAIVFETKGAQDPVSAADRDVERFLTERIRAAFPGDAVLGEEGGFSGQGSVVWVLDPIDGTQVFSLGMTTWCVVVALVVDGVTELALVHDPNAGELFAARRGGGATLDGRPIGCTPDARVDRGLVGIGYPKRMVPEDVLPVFGRLLAAGGMFHRNGSGALSLAYVAAGRLLGYAEARMHAWDCLAGLLLIREAGGRTSGFEPGADLAAPDRVVASAAAIFDQLDAVLG